MHWINIDFYDVFSGDERADMMAILSSVGNREPSPRLADRGEEYSDFIEILGVTDKQVFGGGARIRKMGLPGRFNLQFIQHLDLGIGEDEGLEENVFFLYDEPHKTLALQRHPLFRSTALQRLLEELGETNLFFQPKLRKDRWERLNKMERIGSIEFKLQTPSHHPNFSPAIPALNRFLEEASANANAYQVELKLSMQKNTRKGSLNLNMIRHIVRQLSRAENVPLLKVSGKVEGSRNSETIDFIRDRMVFYQAVEYSTRSVGAEECHRILRRAILDNSEYLKSLL